MEQLNNQTQKIWYRFPILVMDKKLKDIYEEGEVPKEQMNDSWVDIRVDSIVAVRPYYGEELKITATIIHTSSGDDFVVEMKPSTIRKILNYEPVKLENDYKS